MKYRYFLVMNDIYSQVAKSPFHISEIRNVKDTKIMMGLRDLFYIRKATGVKKRDKYTHMWRITDYGEKVLKNYKNKCLSSTENKTCTS